MNQRLHPIQAPTARLVAKPFPLLALTVLCLNVALLAGCDKTTRLMDPSEATKDELRAGVLLPTQIVAFSDYAARQLALDLQDLELINDLPDDTQARVILGDINNQTRRVPTSDFELLTKRFRNKLINSNAVYDRLNFVTERRRTQRVAQQENVVGLGNKVGGQAAYQASESFTLLGDFLEITRGDTSLYYLELQLVSLANNEIVWSGSYDVKQALEDE